MESSSSSTTANRSIRFLAVTAAYGCHQRRSRYGRRFLLNQRKFSNSLEMLLCTRSRIPMTGKITPVLALVVSVFSCASSEKIKVVEESQGTSAFSNYNFIYEDWAQPKIVQLFTQEKLDRFIHEHDGEWQRHVALCNWANAQFPPGQYAYLLADAMKALGYFDVRYVELESKDHNFHFNVEVWNNSWQKWIVLDPFYNVYYEGRDSIPLSALELHELSIQQRGNEAKIHPIEKRDYQPNPDGSIDSYYSFAIGLRNDLAGLEVPLTVRERLRTFLQYQDPRSKDWHPQLVYAQGSSRKEDFAYTCNQVWIRYEIDSTNKIVKCAFETRGSIPHFRRFL